MAAVTSKLTSKAQTTLPKPVREALSLHPGDQVTYEIGEGQVVMRKVPPLDIEYLRALETTLSEWSSEEDAEAYDDL